MMRPRLKITVIFSLVVSLWASGQALPQPQGLIRVGSDGSLIIMDKTTGEAKRLVAPQEEIDLVGTQLQVRIIQGTVDDAAGLPVITRGRSHRQRPGDGPGQPLPLPQVQPGTPPAADSPLSSLIDRSAQQHGVDPGLVRLVVQKESNFNPQAVSPKGAMGLMQLMPGTAALLGVQDPFNPAQNIDGGVRYLKQCLERFDNNVCLALAAYNAGPENVAKYQGVPPFAETRNYVANIVREYTGQPVTLPLAPAASLTGPNPPAGRLPGKKIAFSQADLQPLFLPGGGRVNIIQQGKSKLFEIVDN